ncbi:metallophosphoesterase [Tabrizicola sp. J26]|uniref:metallophosphoesterase family protein n=1 Tax=Alitabrizicola rongguiensis TaxID=2909234 RepID=UPI001F19721C|nr:metallophosphoesterase [Tabrizicola rongguiensis]MCF1709857.1 metallophosphoesterase [Tabrizicola rongguiensis]
MTRLVHLTDLHFGLERADLIDPLREALTVCLPDFVAVSGDLTHRARHGQFQRAMTFLHGLGLPFLVIPGNHDVPLINLAARLFAPFRSYRAGASPDLAPFAEVGPLRLYGTNTADPWRWRRGRLRRAEIDRILQAARTSPPEAINILVCHHPLEEPPGFDRGETRGARAALPALAEAGIRIVLSGHLHHWSIGLGIGLDRPRPLFQMQCGTALCARAGESDHGFAVLDVEGPHLSVTPWIHAPATNAFAPRPAQAFTFRDGLWHSDTKASPAG